MDVTRPTRERFDETLALPCAAAGLGADSANATRALALYETVGMRVSSRPDTWERGL